MALEDAKQLYEAIAEDESLQSEFEGLESQDEVIDKALEMAESQDVDVSRSDIEALMKELADQAEELDDEELEEVAGGFARGCRLPDTSSTFGCF